MGLGARAGSREKAEVISVLRPKYGISDLVKTAGMSRSKYYYWRKDRPDKREGLKAEVKRIYHKHRGRYGYRRIAIELKRSGKVVNHKAVLRAMRELGLKSSIRRKRYKSYRGEECKTVANILNRGFKTDKPNRKWATDVTEFHISGEKRYFSAVLDMYNREVVAYEADAKPEYYLVGKMLKRALRRISKADGLLLHSDQGWQYQQKKYQDKLKSKHVIQSMSRKGNCLDNAVMENFFGHVKSELFYNQKFKDAKEFDRELKRYIMYYNNERIQEKLNGLSPVEYRTQVQISNKIPCY